MGPMGEVSNGLGFGVVLVPDWQLANPQEVAIVRQQLFKTRPGHVCQLNLGLLGRAGGHAAFDDVLLAGPGRLDHLVVGAAAPVNEAVAETDCGVVDDLSLLIGKQLLVAA